MNPCPCGWYGSGAKDCLCSKSLIDRYVARISGPLLDRIDLHVPVPALAATEASHAAPGESSAAARRRVTATRERQRLRNAQVGALWSAQIRARDLSQLYPLTPGAQHRGLGGEEADRCCGGGGGSDVSVFGSGGIAMAQGGRTSLRARCR